MFSSIFLYSPGIELSIIICCEKKYIYIFKKNKILLHVCHKKRFKIRVILSNAEIL